MENMMRTIKSSEYENKNEWRPIPTCHFGVHFKKRWENHLADSHMAIIYFMNGLLSPKMAKLGDPISCCEMSAGKRANVGTVKTQGAEAKMKHDKKIKIRIHVSLSLTYINGAIHSCHELLYTRRKNKQVLFCVIIAFYPFQKDSTKASGYSNGNQAYCCTLLFS